MIARLLLSRRLLCPAGTGPAAERRRARRSFRGLQAGLLVLVATLWPAVAGAQFGPAEPADGLNQDGVNQDGGDQPVALIADDVTYDQELEVIVARGGVEITQGDRIVRADAVTYNRRTEVVTATGNVVVVEPTGEVIHADYAELRDDLADGFAERVSVILTDNARMIGTAGERRDDRYTDVERAVYSPCELCPDNPRAAPIWQLRARQATHDRETRDMMYRDAFLDMWGIPVFYTPYLTHPDGTVKRRSGFLPPRFGVTDFLGAFLQTSYYIDISPEQDMTVQLTGTSDANAALGVEYRRRFAHAAAQINTSINVSDREEPIVGAREDQLRWHVFAEGDVDLGRHWRASLDVARTADDDYLDDFEIDGRDSLETRGLVEGFYGLSYLSGEVVSWQDLRDGVDVQQPLVAPHLRGEYVSEPGDVLGGTARARASLLHLQRPAAVGGSGGTLAGIDTTRLSAGVGWDRQIYTPFGLVAAVSAGFDGQVYVSNNLPSGNDPTEINDGVVAVSALPRASVELRYPFVRRQGTVQQLLEPIVSVVAAPRIDADNEIPNNDSIDPELDELNLFADNRFPGLDRIDGGVRVNYGLHTGVYGDGGGSTTLFIGQSIRFDEPQELPDGTGLSEQFSDLVGRLSVSPGPLARIDYRFRVNPFDFSTSRQELGFALGPSELRLAGVYTFVGGSDTAGGADREQFSVSAASQFSEFWSANTTLSLDVADRQLREVRFGVTYEDECFTFGTVLRRDFTESGSSDGGTSVFVNIGFRNLGEFPLTVL